MQYQTRIPAYERIAIDIANRIYDGQLKVGEKIHGRSTLASEYNVSPETVRKAIKILEDVEIVHSTKGSGVVIGSKDNAFKYINRFSDMKSLKDLELETRELLKEREKLDNKLNETLEKIMDYAGKLRHTNPMTPIEMEITKSCVHIGKTVGEVNFWQHTGGTIVGIKREGNLIISPGPYASFREGDILLVIGDEKIYDRVLRFLNE
ncbi:GntR family transcriptional regulator [Caldibacillus lycopersici]|uniref:GntR family transcriptional regulator n=1 Tax=Perspicuibacillus lycopersici TaxID=1325689 RepID=A0AAE3LP48_9BACI|nr:TrkA C-terminal domain-containing protein [Perspicuibacillus lycopersici]MCU9614621.1 GntR family transcriptional regulator [Perspicuibacillus lycopersici]